MTMRLPNSSKVVTALTLWLMLALSNVGESHGFGFDLGRIFGPKGKSHAPKPTKNPFPWSKSHAPKPTENPPSPSTTPSGLKVGFYQGLCPNNVDIQAILTAKVVEKFGKEPTILPALLRMQFHDCFVHGCDASILINGTSSEKSAGPNLTVRGYDFIDFLKNIAETLCPRVVSCADIIAIATTEVIKQGGGPEYSVQTGRRDGLVSNADDVDLPSPFSSVDDTIKAFQAKKFSPEEMVVLLGCHTVGIAHCAFFQDRLYGQVDTKMDPELMKQLKSTCPNQNPPSNNFANLDQESSSSNKVDNSFFLQIIKQRGILPIDQALARDARTQGNVSALASSASLFNSKLASAMVKLQALEVLTGKQGEIRKTCSRFN